MQVFRAYFKDTALSALVSIAIFLQNLVLMPVLVKISGATIYGSYVLLVATLGAINGLVSAGVGYGYRRGLPSTDNSEKRRRLFYPQLILQIFLLVVFFLLLNAFDEQFIRIFFKNAVSFSILPVLAYLVCYLVYAQVTDYFRYTCCVSLYNAIALVMVACNFVFLTAFALMFPSKIGVNTILNIQAASFLGSSLIGLPKLAREIGWPPSLYDRTSLREDVSKGWPLVLNYFVDMVLNVSDRYIIGFFLGVAAVGYYVPAYSLATVILFFPRITGVVLLPTFSRCIDKGASEEANAIVLYSLQAFLFVAIPYCFGSYALGRELLIFLANAEIAKEAFWVTPLVSLGCIFYGLTLILSNVLFAHGRMRELFLVNVAGCTTNVIVNLILFSFIPNIIVAAITTLLCYALTCVLTAKIALSSLKSAQMSRIYHMLPRLIASALAMLLALEAVQRIVPLQKPLVTIMVLLPIGIAVYGAGIWATNALSRKEWNALKTVFDKKQEAKA